MIRKISALTAAFTLFACPIATYAQVNTTGTSNVSPDNVVDGATGTCSTVGAGAQIMCGLTAAQLQGYSEIQGSFSSIGSGTATPFQIATDGGANWVSAYSYVNTGAPSTGSGLSTSVIYTIPLNGNAFRVNIITLTSGMFTFNYVLKRLPIAAPAVGIQGITGAGSIDGGGPVKAGCTYQTNTTAATTGQKQNSACDPYGSVNVAVYPAMTTAETCDSGNVANGTVACTLAAAANKTTYITGFQMTASGASTGLPVTCTLTGVITGTTHYTFTYPAGVLVPATPLIVSFNPPVPASTTNTTIVSSCPASGSGGTNATMTAQGFEQ